MATWDDRFNEAEQHPVRSSLKFSVIVIFIVAAITSLSFLLGWCGETASVAQKELGASALLKKYEWFKNASAGLDEKVATVQVYEARNKSMRADYGKDVGKWPRDVREQNAIWQSELAGVKASYNMLAAEYNANMAKINWAFTNVGTLPAGAEIPLPREYKPYIIQ
jgi:hypothetical protein